MYIYTYIHVTLTKLSKSPVITCFSNQSTSLYSFMLQFGMFSNASVQRSMYSSSDLCVAQCSVPVLSVLLQACEINDVTIH
jgi:hypothetical protein